jgi:hypothetical protein
VKMINGRPPPAPPYPLAIVTHLVHKHKRVGTQVMGVTPPFALSSAKGHTQSENREFVGQRPDESVRPTIPFPFGLVSYPRDRLKVGGRVWVV